MYERNVTPHIVFSIESKFHAWLIKVQNNGYANNNCPVSPSAQIKLILSSMEACEAAIITTQISKVQKFKYLFFLNAGNEAINKHTIARMTVTIAIKDKDTFSVSKEAILYLT
ncbi:hypothetical protein EfmAA610_20610 [Enterococcus faecium]|nr:hypothetical protein EfmAA610_20610 [Enterococcus faecium]